MKIPIKWDNYLMFIRKQICLHSNYKYNNLGVLKTFFLHFFGGGGGWSRLLLSNDLNMVGNVIPCIEQKVPMKRKFFRHNFKI